MKKFAVVLAAAMLWPAVAPADDLHAEIVEWVFEPCMEVAAALGVGEMTAESRELGIKREHIAEIMLASRDHAIRDIVAKMNVGSNWEERRTAYPVMLRLCISQFTDNR